MNRDNRGLTRRQLMKGILAAGAFLGPLSPLSPFAQAQGDEAVQGLLRKPEENFIFARIKYRGGDWEHRYAL